MATVAEPERAESVTEELGRMLARHADFPNPYPTLARIRRASPMGFAGTMGFVAGYKATTEGLRDQRLSRQQEAIVEEAANATDSADATVRQAHEANIEMLINQDDPGHKRIRRLLEFAFKPSAVATYRRMIDRITTELVDGVVGRREFDFRRELAYPLPERVICEMMGVPYEDHALWGGWAEDIVGSARTHEGSGETAARVEAAKKNFLLYFRDLVEQRRRNLGDDLVSVLIRAEAEGDRLNGSELYGTLQMLVTAGHETTANLIINGMVALLRHPDQYAMLREDPSLVERAVEEMLRYESPAQWALPRQAMEDTVMDGVDVPAGSHMLFALNAANHDPAVFENPDSFDILRDTTRHIAFGAGIHFCMGNQIARIEARTMFAQIMTRLPRLVAVNEPKVRDTFTRSYDALVVRVAD